MDMELIKAKSQELKQKLNRSYKKVTKAQVKSIIKKDGCFDGFMVGCKVNSFHFFSGWNLCYNVKFENVEEVESTVSNWSYYNANSELGKYPSFYQYEVIK